ncbi:hypothetical protein [Nonomuraea diastatica]|uniref:Uncharacterized protein n=1 Tax=Nonomuraea diastatica TaxID=1848329 RepID=A0A4R4W2X1_9ACTN|nr:hypothetical protein [Nonomuraea diastatica]TDD12888.1 hypothetical protein E1294_43135 [Nonomuraea diastatica]
MSARRTAERAAEALLGRRSEATDLSPGSAALAGAGPDAGQLATMHSFSRPVTEPRPEEKASMDDQRVDDRDDEGRSRRERTAAHRLAARHGDAAARRAAARDVGYALPTLEAVERVALALQHPPDPHGPEAAPGDVDDALALLGHARAMLDHYELHLLDAARAAGRDWATIGVLLSGPENMPGGDQARARHAELLRAFPGHRAGAATAAVPEDASPSAATDGALAGLRATTVPLPVHACGIARGVCPEHGATLALEADLTRCQECDATWPGDRLNRPCPEPITRTEEARYLRRTGMCAGHAVALAAVYGIETEPLRPGPSAPDAGAWDDGGEAARYVRSHYRLPPAKRNARITVQGRVGTVLGFRGGYLRTRFDDEPASRVLCHPTAGVTYAGPGERTGQAPTAAPPGRKNGTSR